MLNLTEKTKLNRWPFSPRFHLKEAVQARVLIEITEASLPQTKQFGWFLPASSLLPAGMAQLANPAEKKPRAISRTESKGCSSKPAVEIENHSFSVTTLSLRIVNSVYLFFNRTDLTARNHRSKPTFFVVRSMRRHRDKTRWPNIIVCYER